MSEPRRPAMSEARYLWGGLGLVVLVVLGLSFPLSASGVDAAETAARERAERDAVAVLSNAISPRLASGDIVGAPRRELLEVVRARILDDDRVARVLIWKPDGDLIFSSATRDTTGETFAGDDLRFSQAAGGVTTSVVVEATETTGALHRTLVPFRAPDAAAPHAVVQVDQRYDAIEAEATRTWRLVRIVLLVAFVVLVVLLVLSVRGGRAAASDASRSERLEQELRRLEERARAAEEDALKAGERLAAAERRIKEASALGVPPEVVAQVEELEAELEREVAERERSAGEVQRLSADLEARDAELARAREAVAAAEADLARSEEAIAAATEAEAARSATRLSELETALHDAEERAARAQRDAERATRDVERRAAKDLGAARRESDALTKRIAEAEAALAEARATPAEPERAVPADGPGVLELTLLRDERDVAIADLVRAREELRGVTAELNEARARIAEIEAASPNEPADPGAEHRSKPAG